MLANVRFWSTIAPLLGTQLKRWEQQARKIKNPQLQTLALEKLHKERFNAEVAATLATLAPRHHREHVVEAIVAYEVMYDFLDGLTEQPSNDPLRTGHQLYRPFTDAITLEDTPAAYDYYTSCVDDCGYLTELVRVVRRALAQLPAAHAISKAAQRAATRCAEAQIRAHAAPRLGAAQLEEWAASEVTGTPLGWQELLAGAASSVLSVHALIASAANTRTTPADADEIDTVYLSICALSTMLDGLIDHQDDMQAGDAGYLRYYESHELLANDLVRAARRAIQRAASLRDGPHHVMTLVGVAAYYLSAPTARSTFARPVTQRVREELQPLITPTLAVMRTWRLAKRIHAAYEQN